MTPGPVDALPRAAGPGYDFRPRWAENPTGRTGPDEQEAHP